jgi:gliding motility-associated-like protein
MRILTAFSLLLSLILFHKKSIASHVIGGNIGYEYIGPATGGHEYKILFTYYVDCGSGSAVPNPEATQQIGIYTHDVQNNPMGGNDKTRIELLTVNRISNTLIEPNLPGGCSVGGSTCIREGRYEGTVILPTNFTGYHLFADICCRNASVINVNNPVNEGTGFHAYIPPPLLPNSSPVFTDLPIPFLCINDTTSILNSAYDPDGDLLVFSFVDPFKGFGSQGNYPNPPATLTWPLDPNTPAAGYDFVTQPFGAGGYNYISSSTGLTQYKPTTNGNYAVCVEIKEYRNGNLIGISRRDLLLLAITCPVNPAPNIDPVAGTTNTTFSVEEGETLCFDFGFDDPNNDSLYLYVNGVIFDNSIVNPNATVTSPVGGIGSVATEFCWTTGCGQAAGVPYQFQVSAADRGCPPKTTNEVYQITVTEPAPPASIDGDTEICPNAVTNYSTTSIPNTTYNWDVTNGSIVADNGDNVDVIWDNPGVGTISVNGINQYGCPSEPITLDVTVLFAPSVDLGNDTIICYGDTLVIPGTTDAAPGYTFTWNPTTTMVNNNTITPSVFPTSSIDYVLDVNAGFSCLGSDTIKVTVSEPILQAGVDDTICAGDSTQIMATISGPAVGGSFLWTPSATLVIDTNLTAIAGPSTTTDYVIEVTDTVGCIITDTMTVVVEPGFTLTTSNDTTLCENECFNLFATGATTYSWISDPAIGDTTLSSQTVCPNASTTYKVYGQLGACSDSAEINVTINTLPTVDAGPDVDLCAEDTTQFNASGALDYTWSTNVNISSLVIGNPFASPNDTTEYFVSGIDANGCLNIDSLTVFTHNTPDIDAGEDIWLCPGDVGNMLATSTSTGNYTWLPTTDLSDPNSANPIASPTDTTEYNVTITDAFNCFNSDTVIVYVSPSVPTDAGTDTTICEGDTIVIGGNPTAFGGTTYSWTPANLVDDAAASNPMAFPTATTWFYVATGNDTCVGIDSVLITVNPLPSVNAGTDFEICINDTVSLSATGALDFLWNTTTSMDDFTISNPTIYPTSTTDYEVMGTDALGCKNWDTITVTVNNLPIVDAGVDTSLCFNDTIQLQASGAVNYAWTPVTFIQNENTATPNVFPTTSMFYYVEGTDANTCTNLDSVFVTVHSLPIIDAGQDDAICIGDSIELTATGAVIYNWTDGTNLSDTTIANPFASNTIDETFIVIGEDANGCINSDTVEITVNALPIVIAGTDVQICINDSTQLNASGAVNYSWNNSSSLSDDAIANPYAIPTDTTSFIVTGTDANNCINTDTVIVVVNPLPIVNAGVDTSLCINDSIVISGVGAAINSWTPITNIDDETTLTPTIFPTSTGYFVLTTIDSNNCVNYDSTLVTVNMLPLVDLGPDVAMCIEDSIQLQATGAVIYNWTDGTYLDDTTTATPYANNTIDETFVVTGEDANGCFNSDTIDVIINALPIVNAGNNIQICIGDSAFLSATGAIDYMWDNGNTLTSDIIANPIAFPTDTTQYAVVGTDANNCVNVDSMIVVVNPLPLVDAGMDQDICNGDITPLMVTGADTYVWSPSNSLDNANIANPNANPDTTQTYIVVATDSNMCVNSDSVTINVFRISTIPDTVLCLGDSVQLDVFGSPGTVYNWTPDTELSDNSIANPWAIPSATTTFTVSVADNAGCNDQADVEVTILTIPTTSFTYEVEPACEGIYVELTNTSTDADSYVWTFNNDSTTIEEHPSVIFDYGSEYLIALEGTNDNGCFSGFTAVDLADSFNDYYSIRIPNVFTPNGDGENDVFSVEIPGKLASCLDLNIYNRWGQLIYKSYGNVVSWDGFTPDGTKVPDGSYFYTIDIKEKTYKGHINIFR